MTPGLGPIALVGMPGCGKSTIGRHLARQLGWRFVDSDHEIERQIGGSIRAYFEQHGEAAFRELEQQAIATLCQHPGCVLATGGGAVLREVNRQTLKAGCEVVYLRSTPEELFRRLVQERIVPWLSRGLNSVSIRSAGGVALCAGVGSTSRFAATKESRVTPGSANSSQ